MISLTPDQREAVNCQDNLMLSACPGSGKTRVVIAKLLQLAEKVEATPRSIGCITYTNAAVDEIEARVRQIGTNTLFDRCEVSTIHAFCLQFILRPYSWMVPKLPIGLKILTREMRLFDQLVRIVEDEQGRQPQFRAFEDYASIRMNIDGNPAGSGIEGGIVTDATARRYWELMLANGYIDFSMILYYSLQILRDHPFVGDGLSSRFAWLLVDEFQDTTDVQVEILKVLHERMHSQFFLVGDEHQSIHAFAGARPDLANGFADDIGARQDIFLSGNFRSTEEIITPAQTLIRRNPGMYPSGEAADREGSVSYEHAANATVAVTDYFLPLLEENNIPLGQAAILAPWWRHLVPIATMLRKFDVPVFGPGARPYQRRRLFAPLAEQLGASVASQTLSVVPGVEKALFRLISEAMGVSRFDLFSYSGRMISLALVYEAKRIAGLHPGGMDWLVRCAQSAGQMLMDEEWIDTVTAKAINTSVQEMHADMTRNNVDVANLQIEDLGLFADPDSAIKLITMHNSKGREFDAVAIVHANEGQIPHFTSRTREEFEEARRLFYVGMTRARKHLMVVSDQSDHRNVPTRFIREASLM
ncbi:MAG: ATP-dependent helicase [Alphaproteobacteria bacterium]|nr:ATP-dependent helicase [Alphaproteobacteria bacterium SS10]